MSCSEKKIVKILDPNLHCLLQCHDMPTSTLSGEAEWPQVAGAVIEAPVGMWNLPIVTGRHAQRFPAGLAPIAPHPGALTTFRLGANGQGGDIHIHPQQTL